MKKYFYYGDEDYLLMQELSKLKKKFLTDDSLAIEEFKEKSSVEDLVDAVFSVGLFAKQKLIIYYGIPNIRDDYFNYFKKLFSDESSENTICFILRKMPDKRKKIVKFLMSECQSKEFKKFEVWHRDKVLAIVREMLASKGCEIENIALNHLLDIVGSDLWMISSNIDKIATSILPRTQIKKDDVHCYASNGEQSTFDFIDDFRKKNKQKVFQFLSDIKKPEEAYPLLSMLSSHVRLLLLLKSCNSTNVNDLVKKAGKSPYYVKKLVSDLKLWGIAELKQLLASCHELDYLGKSGKINPLIGLEKIGLETF